MEWGFGRDDSRHEVQFMTDKRLPMPDMKSRLAGSSPPLLALLVKFANLDGFPEVNMLDLGLGTSFLTTAICGC
jgi:hypothetical protein